MEDRLVERGAQLVVRRARLFVFRDSTAHPHHVCERPVGHALAVGEAAAAMPIDGVRDPVEVLVELPPESRLADPSDAGDRQEVRLAFVGAGVELVLYLPELAIATDERGLEALRLERATKAGDTAPRRPQRREALLPLELEGTRVPVDDRLLGRTASRVADEDRAGLGRRLDPRGRVHEVAGDHALALRAE